MDQQALARLGDERIGPDAKGLPVDLIGATVAEFTAQARALFHGGFAPPLLVLHEEALAHNLALMSEYCRNAGVELAPHGKTTMAPQIFSRQLAHGAYGITAATGGHLRVYRAFGVPRVLLASQLVDPGTVAWLRQELAGAPDFEVLTYVDSAAGAELLASEFSPSRTSRPLPVLLEVGYPGGRTGCRDMSQVQQVAKAVADAAGLRLAGVAAFEGTIGTPGQPGAGDRVRSFLGDVRRVAQWLADTGQLDGEMLLSAGGSAYFDRVVAEFQGGWPAGQAVHIVLRSGCYIAHDTGPGAASSPFSRSPYRGQSLRPALELWGQVLSRPEPELALIGFGRRDASFDSALPVPVRVRYKDETTATSFSGASIEALNDQHAYMRLSARQKLAVGDWVGCSLSHACTAFDKWKLIPVMAEDQVTGCVRTFF